MMSPVTSLSELTDDQVLAEYQAIDSDIEADGDPAARAARLDALAAEVLRRDPGNGSFWYDRGMYAKWREDWPASVEYNSRALELIPAEERQGEPAAWNMSVSATAAGDWATARRGWAAFGLQLPPAENENEPILANFGIACVRLNAEPRFVGQEELQIDGRRWDTEVVWARRICPTRMQILSIPTPESGHRCGDVVLHDGDPTGKRELHGEEVSVFNQISLLERSPAPTVLAQVQAPDAAASEALVEALEKNGFHAEDWTGSLLIYCKECSYGAPAAGHHHDEDAWSPQRQVGVSGDPGRTAAIVEQWVAAGSGRAVESVEIALA